MLSWKWQVTAAWGTDPETELIFYIYIPLSLLNLLWGKWDCPSWQSVMDRAIFSLRLSLVTSCWLTTTVTNSVPSPRAYRGQFVMFVHINSQSWVAMGIPMQFHVFLDDIHAKYRSLKCHHEFSWNFPDAPFQKQSKSVWKYFEQQVSFQKGREHTMDMY